MSVVVDGGQWPMTTVGVTEKQTPKQTLAKQVKETPETRVLTSWCVINGVVEEGLSE